MQQQATSAFSRFLRELDKRTESSRKTLEGLAHSGCEADIRRESGYLRALRDVRDIAVKTHAESGITEEGK